LEQPLCRNRPPLQNPPNPFNTGRGGPSPPSALALSSTRHIRARRRPGAAPGAGPSPTSCCGQVPALRGLTSTHRRGGEQHPHPRKELRPPSSRRGSRCPNTDLGCHTHEGTTWRSPRAPGQLFAFPQLPTRTTDQAVPKKPPLPPQRTHRPLTVSPRTPTDPSGPTHLRGHFCGFNLKHLFNCACLGVKSLWRWAPAPIFCSSGNTHHVGIQRAPVSASRATEVPGQSSSDALTAPPPAPRVRQRKLVPALRRSRPFPRAARSQRQEPSQGARRARRLRQDSDRMCNAGSCAGVCSSLTRCLLLVS